MRYPGLKGLEVDLIDVPKAHADLLRSKSRDYYWFSPILKSELDGKVADLVLIPETREQLVRIANACARHKVPVTVRGGGTGNYGQAVPINGGVVLDMTRFDRIISSAPGVGRFEAGARLLEIDRVIRDQGWELRFFPSTRRRATIGGFIAGGAGGVGSCTWGQLADPGAVLATQVLTLEDSPRFIELRHRDALKVLHAYGVNGIITEVEMPLAPCQPWMDTIVTFPDLISACEFGYALAAAEGIAKKLISIHDERIPPLMDRLAPYVSAGRAMAVVMVLEPQFEVMAAMAEDFGGVVAFQRNATQTSDAAFGTAANMAPLYEYAWNHTTWRAMKADPAYTYLQVRYPANEELRVIKSLKDRYPDELVLHLEFQRRFGRVFVSSLPLVRYRDASRLQALMNEIEVLGGQISNPHTYRLEGAGWKRTDAPQSEFKRIADPFNLMNPGKLLDHETILASEGGR
jgi:FAD/FMN-containing dehydrogenase